jgi:hypothetical protein
MDKPENQKDDPGITLDRNSKILFIIIGLLIAGSVAVTFWRYMVRRDYIIQAQTDCDPTTENCFIWKCDPASTVEGETCTGDPESDIWYYKIIHRNAKNIPDCDPKDENCTALVCDPGEKDCSEELCTPENVKAPDTCNDPVQYNIDNPPEGDSRDEECAPDDVECLQTQKSDDAGEACAPDDQECIDAQGSKETQDTKTNPANPDASAPVLKP